MVMEESEWIKGYFMLK